MNQIKEINRRENTRKKSARPTTEDAPNPLGGGGDGEVPVQNIQPTSPCKPLVYTRTNLDDYHAQQRSQTCVLNDYNHLERHGAWNKNRQQ